MKVFDMVVLSPENWISIVQILIAIGGGLLAIAQWRKNVVIRHAEFVGSLFDKLQFDNDLRLTMYSFDYSSQDWYSIKFHGSEWEKKVDQLFSVLDYICLLKERRLLKESEFNVFQYRVVRVCQSESTKKYLWNLFHFSRSQNTKPPFIALIDVAIQEGWFPEDFKTNVTLYPKVLNF